LLSDHGEGVLCQANPESILEILLQHGFTLQNQTNEDDKAVWTVAKNGGNNEQSDEPNPPSNDDNEADADAEDQGGDDEAK
jgi:hypothetical protein